MPDESLILTSGARRHRNEIVQRCEKCKAPVLKRRGAFVWHIGQGGFRPSEDGRMEICGVCACGKHYTVHCA